MIIYDLVCDAQHRFEGWFKNADEYAAQLADGLLSCPACSSAQVHKVLSVSHVNTAPNTQHTQPADTELTAKAKPQELLKKLHEYIEQSFDNVGTQFAEEARKIHYGETEKRSIYGQATGVEINELREEGIDAVPLPARPRDKSKLN